MRDRPHGVHHGTTQWGQQSEDIILIQHHNTDGSHRDVEVIPCYKVPKNTQCWLSVSSGDMPFITTKTVFYTDDDLLDIIEGSYYFCLPPNDKNASYLIVQRDFVLQFASWKCN